MKIEYEFPFTMGPTLRLLTPYLVIHHRISDGDVLGDPLRLLVVQNPL